MRSGTSKGGPIDRVSDALASLRLAVVLLGALGMACIVATFYEAQRGTAAAQRVFYRSAWFTALLALLAANILWSVVRRYPWNRHHAGFLLAHAGILLILAGSGWSLHGGLDGRVALFEGETTDRVSLSRESLRVTLPGGTEATLPVAFTEKAPAPGQRLPLPGSTAVLVVEEFRPHVSVSETLGEGDGGASNPALHFTLATSFLQQEGWLVAGGLGGAERPPAQGASAGFTPARAEDAEHHEASFGPVVFSFHRAARRGSDEIAPARTGNGLAFLLTPGGRLHYVLTARNAPGSSGLVELGKPIRTPWMDMTVKVDRLLENAAMRRVVARAPLPVKEEDRVPAVHARVEGAGPAEPEWLVWGEEERTVKVGGGEARLAYGPAGAAIPFRVTLLQFKSDKYPGSSMAASYESRVRVEDPELGSTEHVISMNRPLHHRGYTFFQSSFVEGRPMMSILSVARSPGLPLVYLGTALLSLGVLWMFSLKRWLARRQGREALRVRQAAAFLASLSRGRA